MVGIGDWLYPCGDFGTGENCYSALQWTKARSFMVCINFYSKKEIEFKIIYPTFCARRDGCVLYDTLGLHSRPYVTV